MDAPHLIKGGVAVDDRGIVTFCNEFDMTDVKRFYMLENHEAGFVRAWHGHKREAKWITVVSGVAIVAAVKMPPSFMSKTPTLEQLEEMFEEPHRYVLHANGDALYVPPGYANGHENLVLGTRVVHFSNMTMDEARGDDYRFSWEMYRHVWEAEYR